MKSSLLMCNPVYPHTLQVLKGQRVGPNSVKTLGQELKRPRGLARVPSAVRLTGSPRPGFRLREILIEIRPPGSELL